MKEIKLDTQFGLEARPLYTVTAQGPIVTPDTMQVAFSLNKSLVPVAVDGRPKYDYDPQFASAVLRTLDMPIEAFQRTIGDLGNEFEGVENALKDACKAWASWAQWRKVYDTAEALRNMATAENTGNEWVITKKDSIIYATASNEAFKLSISIKFPYGTDISDKEAIKTATSIVAEYVLSTNYCAPGSGLPCQKALKTVSKHCKSFFEAEKYLEGRVKALHHFISEERPSIPKMYAHFFSFESVPLPCYTYTD